MSRFIRLSAAAALLFAVVYAIAPYATNYVSISAVVNAPLIPVDAPFKGIITTPSRPVITAVHPETPLFTITRSDVEGSQMRALESRMEAIEGEISGIKTQYDDLETLKSTLIERREAQYNARIAWFEHRIDEARANVEQYEVAVQKGQENLDRVTYLTERNIGKLSEQIEAETTLATARANLSASKATVQRLLVERDSINQETGVDLSSDDMDSATYRLDEITVRQAELMAAKSRLLAQKNGLQAEINGLSDEQNEQNTFTPLSTREGIIWETSKPVGSVVSSGESVMEILDCERRFLEVELPEHAFKGIVPGSLASVTLKGSTETFQSKVIAVYGGNATPNRRMQAANPRISINGGLRVVVLLNPVNVSDESVARSFCDVGRSAEVFFKMPEANIIERLRNFF